MDYLITAKTIKDGKPAKQEIWNAHDILNFVRKVFVKSGRDENSADIQALDFMRKVDNTGAQVMRNENNGHVLVIQQHNPTE